MDIDKQAKALLCGEVVEIVNSHPIKIISMNTTIDVEHVAYVAYKNTRMDRKMGRARHAIEAELYSENFNLDYNKEYYLIEVER